jgi:hypothetical protein
MLMSLLSCGYLPPGTPGALASLFLPARCHFYTNSA